jgi:hypothetical protein
MVIIDGAGTFNTFKIMVNHRTYLEEVFFGTLFPENCIQLICDVLSKTSFKN